MPYVERVAVDQVAAELCDVGLDGGVAVGLGVGLAPSGDARVGLDLDEYQILAHAGVDGEDLDVGDFHCYDL